MLIPEGHLWSIVSVTWVSLIGSINRPSGFLYKASKYICSKALVPLCDYMRSIDGLLGMYIEKPRYLS